MVNKLLKILSITLILQISLTPIPLLAKRRLSYKSRNKSRSAKYKNLQKQNEILRNTIDSLKKVERKLKQEKDSLEILLNSSTKKIDELNTKIENLNNEILTDKKLEKFLSILKLLVTILIALVLINIFLSFASVKRKNDSRGKRFMGYDEIDLKKISVLPRKIENLDENIKTLDKELVGIKNSLNLINNGINSISQRTNTISTLGKLPLEYFTRLQKNLKDTLESQKHLINQFSELNRRLSQILINKEHSHIGYSQEFIDSSNVSDSPENHEPVKSSSKAYFTSLTEERKETLEYDELKQIVENWKDLDLAKRKEIFDNLLKKDIYLLDPQLELNDNVIEISNFVQNVLTRKFGLDDINRFFEIKSNSGYITKTVKPAILRRINNEYLLKETGELH